MIEPTEQQIRTVIANMSAKDAANLLMANYHESTDDYIRWLHSERAVFKRCIEGAAVIGYKETSPGVVTVFAITAPKFKDHIIEVTKYVKGVLFPGIFSSGYHRIQAIFAAEDDAMARWVEKSLGSTDLALLNGFAKDGRDMVMYSWLK